MRHLFLGSALWTTIWADATAAGPAGAVLRLEDRVPAEATHLTASPSGGRVLVWGPGRAILFAPDATEQTTVLGERIGGGAVADDGTFVLAHGGGITVHGPAGREQLRIPAPPGLTGVAISADGTRIAVAGGTSVTVNDAVTGRPRFTVNQGATAVSFGADDALWAVHEGGASGYDVRGRASKDSAPPTPAGLLADGCLGDPEGGALCVTAPAWQGEGQLWSLDAEGGVAPWQVFGPERVEVDPSAAPVTAISDGGPGVVLVARADGTLERRTAGDAVSVSLPGCTPCVPSLGGDEGGFWALAAGTFQAWDAAGQASLKRPVATDLVAVGRLADGQWVGLATDGRVRIGPRLGKGKPRMAVAEPIGLHAAGETVAVWSTTALQVLDGEGLLRSSPGIGADRVPVAVRLSPDGARVAVIDDAGALHLYEATGRAVFRLQAELSGTALAFDPTGALVVAGGSPLRGFSTADGAESVRVLLADGAQGAVVRADGALLVVDADGQGPHTVDPALLAPTPEEVAVDQAQTGG